MTPILLTFLAAAEIRWIPEGPRPDTIAVTPAGIEVSGRGSYPNWIRSEREYENFKLRFDYRLAQWSEAAVILRAPKWGRPMRSGLAISLAHDFHRRTGLYVTGAISGVKPPVKYLRPGYDEWKHVEIVLHKDDLTVLIDGEMVQQHRLDRTYGPGHVVFPDLGHRYSVRRIELDDLGAPSAIVYPFRETGTRRGESGTWTVNGSTITGADGHSILYAPGPYGDFILQLYVRSHNRVNAGVFLRGSARPDEPRGFEVQVYSPPDAVYPTGSIYNAVRSDVEADYEERWFWLEISLLGRACQVRIDGRVVARTSAIPQEAAARGQIGLQIHSDRGRVEFDSIRVLPAARVLP